MLQGLYSPALPIRRSKGTKNFWKTEELIQFTVGGNLQLVEAPIIEDHLNPSSTPEDPRVSNQLVGGGPRRKWFFLGALVVLTALLQTGAWADGNDEFTPEQREAIQKMIKEMRMEEMRKSGGLTPFPPSSDKPGPEAFTGGGTLLGGRTIYAKPFVKSPKAVLGGYMDFEVTDCNGSAKDCSEGLEFDQVRFIPFIYSNVTDRIQVAAEIEFEHGGTDNNQGDGEVKVEFATFDYLIEDWVNFRAGILLSPLGRFNLLHYSPLNDLTHRPLVSRFIIPSTLSESGLGLYGTFYPTRLSKVDYEVYVVNGFDGETKELFSEADGVSKSKGSQKTDNNQSKSILARVAVSPFLGVEVGGSIHHGKWDDAGDKDLTITAVDWSLQRGPFEIIGESAWAHIEGGDGAPSAAGITGTFDPDGDGPSGPTTAGTPPRNMAGFYVQGNYHFMPAFLKRMAPTHFTDASTFTAVIRYGEADTNTDSSINRSDFKRLTIGANFRPIEDTVFKLGYTFNDEEAGSTDTEAPSDNPGRNNGWQFSVATYF